MRDTSWLEVQQQQQRLRSELICGLVEACATCASEECFAELIRTWVRPLLPHGVLIAALGRIDLEHLQIQRAITVDCSPDVLPQIRTLINLRDRPVLQRWLRTREPQVLQLPDDEALMSALERKEIQIFGLGRIAIHGVVDLMARSGSYFSFGRVDDSLDREVAMQALRLVVPSLHQALLQTFRAAGASCRDPLAELTPTERELMHWVLAGRSNGEIAQLRNRSPATVRNQIHSAFVKMGVGSRSEAIRMLLHDA